MYLTTSILYWYFELHSLYFFVFRYRVYSVPSIVVSTAGLFTVYIHCTGTLYSYGTHVALAFIALALALLYIALLYVYTVRYQVYQVPVYTIRYSALILVL